MLRLLLGVLLLALASVVSTAQEVQSDELYQADDDTPQGQGYVDVEPVATPEPAPLPTIFPYFNGGMASQAAVSRSVGGVRYKIISCPPLVGQLSYEDATHVRATLGKSVGQSITERPAMANTIMAGAAQFAWKECPQPFFFLLEPRDEFHYNVRHVEIVDAEGNMLLSGQLGGYGLDGYSDQPLASSRKGYKWQDVRDVLAENNAAAARDLAEQQAQEERIEVRQQADAEAQVARQSFFDFWKAILFLAMFFGVALWLFANFEAILTFFYGLVPHPATSIVSGAIARGEPIDGETYAAILRPNFSNSIENTVRMQQADELTQRLRAHEAAMAAESAQHVEAIRKRAEQDAAFIRAHSELLKAGISHEEAAATLDEWRKVRRI